MRILSWYGARRWWMRILIGLGVAILLCVIGYISGRSLQYLEASRTSAGLYEPEDADLVVRVTEGSAKWRAIQATEFWNLLRKRIQQDAGVRGALNDVLASFSAPTLDQIEDQRWRDRNPMVDEPFLLRIAGRDVLAAMKFARSGSTFCVASRIGWSDYLLVPLAQLFPGFLRAEKVDVGGQTALRQGKLYLAFRGAIVLASNDRAMLGAALKRRGTSKPAGKGLISARISMERYRTALSGFPAGALFTFADVQGLQTATMDLEILGPDLIVRARAEGLAPRSTNPSPDEAVRMVPANGVGAVLSNVEAIQLWEWIQRIARPPGADSTPLDQFAYENFREFVAQLHTFRVGHEVVAHLDRPTSILLGASRGESGLTYAAMALVLRSSRSKEAGAALQRVIDKAIEKVRKQLQVTDLEIAGYSMRSYSYSPDVMGLNNYLCLCYAVTSDALIIANNAGFLEAALRSFANQQPSLITKLEYEHALRRLGQIGMVRVMTPEAPASLFFYGPAIREGLEGFYGTLASRTVDTQTYRVKLRAELEQEDRRAGLPTTAREMDDKVDRVLRERIREWEEKLRAKTRILDVLKWVAFQAVPVEGGMELAVAIELK